MPDNYTYLVMIFDYLKDLLDDFGMQDFSGMKRENDSPFILDIYPVTSLASD